MEYFFTYTLSVGNRVVRIGKGHCFFKSATAVQYYLKGRRDYKDLNWTHFSFTWRASEAAAYYAEQNLLAEYESFYGSLPLWNRRRGGGGRQIYKMCKGFFVDGRACFYNALAGNYGYCGKHR
jgi:hypothetical protein